MRRKGRRLRNIMKRVASFMFPGRGTKVKRILGVAAQAQTQLQLGDLPTIPSFSLGGDSRPASAAGGDFFHCMQLDTHRWGLAVGDFSGHDLWAAFFTNLTKGSLMAAARDHDDPRRVLVEVNHDICQETDRSDYVTLAYGVIDTRTHCFRFARAGDVQVMWRRGEGGSIASSRKGSLALGWVPSAVFEEQVVVGEIQLEPGDAVLLFTDGVLEARGGGIAAWGFDGVERAIRAMDSVHASNSVVHVLDCLDEHVGSEQKPHDDVTLLVLQADPR